MCFRYSNRQFLESNPRLEVFLATADVLAERVLCALRIFVSIPQITKTVLIQRLLVAVETDLCVLNTLRANLFPP